MPFVAIVGTQLLLLLFEHRGKFAAGMISA